MKRNKSFVTGFMWVGIMLIAMGLIFSAVGIVMRLIPLEPDQVNYYRNGVRMPSTEETVSSFRALFFYIFGGFGVVMLTIGGIILGKYAASRRIAARLKENGVRVYAQLYELSPTFVRVNNRSMMRLRCTYNDASGTTYIFKSGMLRADPTPFLRDGRVTVYYDRDNMRRYFVDIDGSIDPGMRIVEL